MCTVICEPLHHFFQVCHLQRLRNFSSFSCILYPSFISLFMLFHYYFVASRHLNWKENLCCVNNYKETTDCLQCYVLYCYAQSFCNFSFIPSSFISFYLSLLFLNWKGSILSFKTCVQWGQRVCKYCNRVICTVLYNAVSKTEICIYIYIYLPLMNDMSEDSFPCTVPSSIPWNLNSVCYCFFSIVNIKA